MRFDSKYTIFTGSPCKNRVRQKPSTQVESVVRDKLSNVVQTNSGNARSIL